MYEKLFLQHCAANDLDMARHYAPLCSSETITAALEAACVAQQIPLIKYLHTISVNSMYTICKSGIMDLVRHFIDEYVHDDQNHTKDWQAGFEGACRGGHTHIAVAMVRLSGIIPGYVPEDIRLLPPYRQLEYYRNIDRSKGFHEACDGGHLEIIKLLETTQPHARYYMIKSACTHGYVDILKNITVHAYSPELLVCAARSGRLDIVKFIIAKFTQWKKLPLDLHYWAKALRWATIANSHEVVDFLIECGARSLGHAFYTACCHGHLELAKKFWTHRLNVRHPDELKAPFLLDSQIRMMNTDVARFLRDELALYGMRIPPYTGPVNLPCNIPTLKILIEEQVIKCSQIPPLCVGPLLDHGLNPNIFVSSPMLHLEVARLQTARCIRMDILYQHGFPLVIAGIIADYEPFF
jgi:hypothetical protein